MDSNSDAEHVEKHLSYFENKLKRKETHRQSSIKRQKLLRQQMNMLVNTTSIRPPQENPTLLESTPDNLTLLERTHEHENESVLNTNYYSDSDSECDDNEEIEREYNEFDLNITVNETSSDDENVSSTKFGEAITSTNMPVKTFQTLFIALVDKLELPEKRSDILLDFVRLLLPINNNLPSSSYMIKKSMDVKLSQYKICKNCFSELSKNVCEKCNDTNASKIKIHTLNIAKQIITILDNHICHINDYKGKIL